MLHMEHGARHHQDHRHAVHASHHATGRHQDKEGIARGRDAPRRRLEPLRAISLIPAVIRSRRQSPDV